MVRWVHIALEEGVRFFVTSLGNPRWVVDAAAPVGGVVYHDVTARKWALKGRDGGVHGLIAVNARAGGHAGTASAEALLDELRDLALPVLAAGGVGNAVKFARMLRLGYAGVQVGERDVVLTERLTGVPVAVLRTPYVERLGTRVGPLARWMFRGRRTKHWARTWFALRAMRQLKRTMRDGARWCARGLLAGGAQRGHDLGDRLGERIRGRVRVLVMTSWSPFSTLNRSR
jgi:nitronate monooxygenase